MSILDDTNDDTITESFLNDHKFKDGYIYWEGKFISGKSRTLKMYLDFDLNRGHWLVIFDIFYSPTKGLIIMQPDIPTLTILSECLKLKFDKCITYSTSKSELLIMMSKDFVKSHVEKL